MTYAHARTPDMSLEEYDRVRAAIGPEPIDGNLEHHVGLEDGALCRRRQVVVEGPDRPVRRDTALPGLRRRRGTPRRRADHLRLRLHRPQLTDLADPLRVAPGRRALQPVDRDRRAPRPPRPRRPLECRPRIRAHSHAARDARSRRHASRSRRAAVDDQEPAPPDRRAHRARPQGVRANRGGACARRTSACGATPRQSAGR